MKKIFYLAFLGLGFLGFAQNSDVPEFYKEMKSASPNLNKVEELYEKYRRETPITFNEEEQKKLKDIKAKMKGRSSWLSQARQNNAPTKREFRDQYEKEYLEWRRLVQPYIQGDGSIKFPTEEEIEKTFYQVPKDTPTPSDKSTSLHQRVLTSENQTMAISSAATALYGSETTPYHSTFNGWKYFGIVKLMSSDGREPVSDHANVRAFAQSESNPNVVVCAVENGTVYISHNKGKMWHLATKNYNIKGITALAISPNDENVIYASGDRHYVTRDGGATWMDITSRFTSSNELSGNVLPGPGNHTSKILIQKVDNNALNDIILYATSKGLVKITRQVQSPINPNIVGYSFERKLGVRVTDIIKRTNRNEYFALGYDTTKNKMYFYSSTDAGNTWTRKGVGKGWFEPTGRMQESKGGRLAMSLNNENVVYAYLIESHIAGDNGFLGVFRSDDGGENWTLPDTAGPGRGTGYHNVTRPNLVTFPWRDHSVEGYNQGFYNCAIMVNPNNADHIILGGLNAYESTNGGKTFSRFGGYYGKYSSLRLVNTDVFNIKPYIHADMQTFYQQKNADGSYESWLTTDGGIHYSTDFFVNQNEVRTAGLGSDYWGFDLGEYNTNMGGGMYHNGDNYYISTYNSGMFKAAGGGENSTGYIFPDEDEQHFYFSDVGGIMASKDFNTPHTTAAKPDPVPTEPYAGGYTYYTQRDFRGNTYYFVEEKVNNIFTGKMALYRFNRIDKTSTLIKELQLAGGTTNFSQYVVSFSQPRFQYIIAGNKLYASEDGGANWEERVAPFTNNAVISLSDKDPRTFWALKRYENRNGYEMLKKTTDGGKTYTRINNPDGRYNYRHIINVRGTDVIFLFGNNESRVFYRLNDNDTWKEYSEDLPTNLNVLEPKIQYRSGEFYMATSGTGIWTRKLPDDVLVQMNAIKMNIDAPAKMSYVKEFQFKPTNISLYHGKNITKRLWEFPGSSQVLNADTDKPTVSYNKFGRFPVKLTLTDDSGKTYSQTFPDYFTVYPFCACDVPNALKNNLGSINVWVEASKINVTEKTVTDKATGIKYNIVGTNGGWAVEQAPNLFNGQKVLSIKASENNIDLMKDYEGQTIFVVSKLNPATTISTFLLGSTSNADFHGGGSLGPIFSPRWVTDPTRFTSTGAKTMINGIQRNFTSTNFVTNNLAVYGMRIGEGKTPAKVRYISKDRANQRNRTFLGEIAEVIVINKRLTDAEMTEINQHLMTKYGIQ